MTLTEHPTDDMLQNYGLGKLAAESSTYVDHHLTVCEDCRRRAAEVSGDGFVKRMEKAAGTDGTGSYLAQSAAMPEVAVPKPATDVPSELAALSEYTDVRELGRGGMGVVYLARHTLSGREEVLKVVNKGLMSADGALDRFLREIRAACALDHPNIVTAYGAQQSGDLLVLRMAYVPGHDLSKYVKQHGPLSVARACYYVYQVAQGLQYAHEQGTIHRDIKPANLMLMQQGSKQTVKILDFGLAKSKAGADRQMELTGTGKMIGTPLYMAPEQFKDAAGVDIRADLYAVGCTLFYLLAGRPPFEGGSVVDMYLAHTNTPPEPLTAVRPDVPAALSDIVAKLLSKKPADRFEAPCELAKALRPFFEKSKAKSKGELAAADALKDTGIKQKTVADGESVPTAKPRAEATWEAVIESSGMTQPIPTTTEVAKWWSRSWPLVTGGILLAVLGIGAAFLAGVTVKTKDGTIELTDLAPGAEVYVDGEVVQVRASSARQPVEIRVKPGIRRLEVRHGGVKIIGEDVEVEEAGRKMLSAKLVRPIAKGGTPSPVKELSAKVDPPSGSAALPTPALPPARETDPSTSADSLFKAGSVWKGKMVQTKGAMVGSFESTLTVIERNGSTAKIRYENNINGYTVPAHIEGGKLSWDIGDAVFYKGTNGHSHSGMVDRNIITMTHMGKNANGVPNEGVMTLALYKP